MVVAFMLTGCGLGWKELVLKDRGMSISFPCRYQEKERNAYNCGDDWTYSYTVWLKAPASISYDDQLELYNGFASRAKESITMNVSERQVNGFRIIQYDEDEAEPIDGNRLRKKTRFLDIFKDDFKIEVSAWAARDARHGNEDLEAMMRRDFEPFFASLKLGQ